MSPIHAAFFIIVLGVTLALLQITEGDEFTPLIQRHISVATQELRAEIASEKSQTTTQLSALRSDIEEIKAQIQELKTRSSSN